MKSRLKSRLFAWVLRSAFSFPSPANTFSVRDRKTLALAALVALFSAGQTILAAQQPGQPGQGWAQNNPSYGQYPPQYQSQQPSYSSQQGYAQPQQYGQQPSYDQPDPYSQYEPSQPAIQPQAPLGTEQLEQLVAPIALYPDTLVAQVLAAATYPDRVVDADHWRQAQGYATLDQIAYGADAQSWDPSLKALTAFPQVLAEMDQNLRWTIALGNAYYNQPQEVLDVVQVMRQRAQAAGNLQSTPQEGVNYDQGYIQLAPPDPQTVYVPAYDPWSVYGQPIQPYRGFSLLSSIGSFLGSSPIRYGMGVAMSAFSHTSFGWLGWGLDWLTHSVLFHNSSYSSRSTSVADWGLPHGGSRAFGPRGYGQGRAIATREPERNYRPQPGYGRSEPSSYSRSNRLPMQESARPVARYPESRPTQNSFSPYPSPRIGDAYPRQPLEAQNRFPAQINRPQPYARPNEGYGAGFYGNANRYPTRPNPVDNAPSQLYRGYEPQGGSLGGKSWKPEKGNRFNGYSSKPPKSGGFHPFGGGHEPKGFSGGNGSGRGSSGHGGHSGGGFFGGHRR